jgi:hypothetical protein
VASWRHNRGTYIDKTRVSRLLGLLEIAGNRLGTVSPRCKLPPNPGKLGSPVGINRSVGFIRIRAYMPDGSSRELGTTTSCAEEDVNGTFQEVKQFVLFGMHLPLVAHTRRLRREDTDLTPIEPHS